VIIAAGKVPRRDRRNHSHRLLLHDDARIGLVGGNDLAIDALGFLGEEL
jgi:hypothetical protein